MYTVHSTPRPHRSGCPINLSLEVFGDKWSLLILRDMIFASRPKNLSMGKVAIDTGLVRTLLREQHPDLAGLPLRLVDGGWDNKLWRLGEDLAVRLPRTSRAPDLLRNEQRWLPVLAPLLPLAVPTPVRIGEPAERFPRPWGISAWVPGEPGDRAAINRAEDAAGRLAGFLRALHRKAPSDAPVSPRRGVALRMIAHEFDQRLHAVASTEVGDGVIDGLPGGGDRDVRRTWERAVTAPEWDRPPVWLHSDLHPANVVVSAGTLSGVIDFGDLCTGDPAADLAAAWVLLPAGSAPRFFDAYGHADEAMIRRARGWAVLRALSLIDIGRAGEKGLPGGKPTWGPAGRAALRRVLELPS